jgi:hypothetical protein
MPSLGSHLTTAYGLATRLGNPHIDADRGAYYLGSTAPDMRILMRVDRKLTHFFDLGEFEDQDSIASMFEAHPELGEAVTLDEATCAFVAGYMTHLLMDEHYIQSIYRTYFGERSALGGDMWANLLDRALQYEMNRRELEDDAALADVRDAIDASQSTVGVRFIDAALWPEWRDFTRGITHQRPDWERFPRVMQIHLRRAGFSDEQIEEIGENPPQIVDEAFEHVTDERLARYLEEATELAFERLREYLPSR